MDFTDQPRRRNGENIVPMINVVFLLLIFFLMTAQIAPPEPLEVNPPQSQDGEQTDGTAILFLSATGGIAFEALRGDEAISRFAEVEDGLVRVDADLPAADLAKTLATLRAFGVADVGIITVSP